VPSTGSPNGQKTRDELEQEIRELRDLLEEALAEIERLRRSLEAAVRAGKRQASPFRRRSRKANPKSPGRRKGEGAFRHRGGPDASSVSEPPIRVHVEDEECPGCGGPLEHEKVDEVSVTDVSEAPKPQTRVFLLDVSRCARCGRRVRARHPAVAPDQRGATAHRVGPTAMAMAHTLHYGLGVPVRRTPEILRELLGISLTQGAITQDAARRVKGSVGAIQERLRASIRTAPVVYTDDTGWMVGAKPAQLMVFDTDEATVYQIRPQHRNEEVRELVPSDFSGVLVTDRGKSYEAEALSAVKQQKCIGHVLRNVKEVTEEQGGPATEFSLRLSELLKEALALGKRRQGSDARVFSALVDELDAKLTHHLRPRKLQNPDNQRLLDGVGAQHAKGRLLRFLRVPGVEPTNNRSERALRPAVIARKVSQCSKTQGGAEAHSAFTSAIRTAIKRGATSVVAELRRIFVAPPEERPPR
jgi:transposase